jgi:molecular chaperone GrpE
MPSQPDAAAATPNAAPSATAPEPTPAPAPAADAAAAASQSVVAELEARLSETMDKYLRVRADFDNYRKRVHRDLADLREQTKAMTAEEFLPVYDYLQIAMDHARTATEVKALTQGMEMIANEFSRALSNLGIEPIAPAGELFDPTVHEAVSQEPSSDVPAGRIVRVWKCGFRNGERLLRPATVVVSSGASPIAKTNEEPAPPAA